MFTDDWHSHVIGPVVFMTHRTGPHRRFRASAGQVLSVGGPMIHLEALHEFVMDDFGDLVEVRL
jgi:hypothetical protein